MALSVAGCSDNRLPHLPFQQFAALESFSLLLKAANDEISGAGNDQLAAETPSCAAETLQPQQQRQGAAEVLQALLSERRNFYFPLIQDQRQQRMAPAADLEQQLQLQQLSQRLEYLGQQQSAASVEPMSVQCQRRQQQQELLRALQQEERQCDQQQQELQEQFYMPAWCEGVVALRDNGASCTDARLAAEVQAVLQGARSRLLADFVLCATAACSQGRNQSSCCSSSTSDKGSTSLCALLSAIASNNLFQAAVSDEEAAELVLLATLQGIKT